MEDSWHTDKRPIEMYSIQFKLKPFATITNCRHFKEVKLYDTVIFVCPFFHAFSGNGSSESAFVETVRIVLYKQLGENGFNEFA